jgi:RNA polymerase sigma-70 factor (ECF subfamily)
VIQDADFITRLKQGDSDAFRKLVEQHQVPLIKLCKGFLHNEEEARDVVQDTFIEVFESIRHFRENARLSTWMYRIAVNKSLNLIRKNRISGWLVRLDLISSLEKVDGEQAMESAWQVSEEVPGSGARIHIIRKAVDSLPESQRIAFVLHKYLDLSYKEISIVMEVTLPAVESLIHRARQNLQKKLYTAYKKNLL